MSTLGLDAISTSKDVQRLWICGKILGGGDRAYIKEIHFRQTERGLKVVRDTFFNGGIYSC